MLTPLSVTAITIDTRFIPEGGTLPGVGTARGPSTNTSGGGNLQDIMEAAAYVWEQLITDDFTLTLAYGWYPTEPTSFSGFHHKIRVGDDPPREIAASIAFNSNNSTYRLFLDSSPEDNAEFGTYTEDETELGTGLVNTKRDFSPISADAIGSIDLFSTAMHEIGHALGLVPWPFFEDETADGDIDVQLPGYEGVVIPVDGAHIDVVGPMMSSTGRTLGHRRWITEVDLLAVCQLSQFAGCALGEVFDGDLDGDGFVGINDLNLVLANWNQNVPPADPASDPSGDGFVGIDDLNLVLGNWNGGIPPQASHANTIPEPASISVLLLAGPLCLRRTRHHR